MSAKLPPLPERETLRLHQANERTLLAWIRTSLAMMGFGFVVARFGLFLEELAGVHGTNVPPGAPWSLFLGAALTLAGVAIAAASTLRFRAIAHAIERHEVGAPGHAWVLFAAVATATLGLAVLAVLVIAR